MNLYVNMKFISVKEEIKRDLLFLLFLFAHQVFYYSYIFSNVYNIYFFTSYFLWDSFITFFTEILLDVLLIASSAITFSNLISLRK